MYRQDESYSVDIKEAKMLIRLVISSKRQIKTEKAVVNDSFFAFVQYSKRVQQRPWLVLGCRSNRHPMGPFWSFRKTPNHETPNNTNGLSICL